jgi:hypothetical protein
MRAGLVPEASRVLIKPMAAFGQRMQAAPKQSIEEHDVQRQYANSEGNLAQVSFGSSTPQCRCLSRTPLLVEHPGTWT